MPRLSSLAFIKSLLVIVLFSLLFACGGSSNSNNQSPPIEEQPVLPEISPVSLRVESLKPASAELFERHLKNGLYLLKHNNDSGILAPTVPSADVNAGSEAFDNSFSVTTTQELGVDESDIVKYDGQYLYVSDIGYFGNGIINPVVSAARADINNTSAPISHEQQESAIRVYERNTETNNINLINVVSENVPNNINGLYRWHNQLVVIGQDVSFYDTSDFWGGGASRFSVSIADVSAPSNAQINTGITIDGNLLGSRLIDDTLVLISSYWADTDMPHITPQSDTERLANLQHINSQSLESLLPKVSINDNAVSPLVDAQNCFIAQSADHLDGFNAVVSMTTIDLNAPTSLNTRCINTQLNGIYATPSDIFVFGFEWSPEAQTVIHHFPLDTQNNTVNYNGSAILTGRLGWSLPALRMSATADELRVVTTQAMSDEDDRWDHSLSIFSLHDVSADNRLALLSQLPNEQRPQEIGKPNEDVTAVRYFGDKAYVVTFERIDPFYVIDMVDPASPFIQSSLQMPGFSSYLQPLSDQYILGVGQNVDPNRFTQTTQTSVNNTDIIEGAKVALFDVSGEQPVIVDEVVFAGAATPVEFDYKALTQLQVAPGQWRFALPMQSWQVVTVDGEALWQSDIRLSLLDINLDAAVAPVSLRLRGEVRPPLEALAWGTWQDRSVLHNDNVYYIKSGRVWQSVWQTPDVINGPY